MSTPLPPDPYVALGLEKVATPAQIKTTYRKLVLKCHPDKVTDESKKAQAADDFHKIQQAYEILSDEGRRSRYDAQVKLVALRKEAMARQPSSSPHTSVRTAAYDVPASSPGRAAFTARGPERVYEERNPQKSTEMDGDYFGNTRTGSRKYDDYGKPVRKDDTDRVRVNERENKANERFVRKDKGRSRDKETKRERARKFSYAEDDSEPDLRYEAMRRRDMESQRERERLAKLDREREREREKERERELREREKARERVKEREREREREEREKERERDRSRRRPEGYEKTSRRYSEKEEEARAYMTNNTNRDKRPSPSSRNASYVEVDRSGRPVMIRRSSTRDKPASPQSSSRRDRDRARKLSDSDMPDTPEVIEDRRTPTTRTAATRPTMLHTAQSSPANIKVPRDRDPREKAMPPRSMSAQFDDRDMHDPPRASLRRSETDPIHNTSPRRKDSAAPLKKSGLRQAETTEYQPTPPATPDPYVSKHRSTPDDEPDHPRDRRMTRSPSPMARPTRPSINTSSRYPSQSQTSPPRPSPSYSYSPATTAEPSPLTARPPPPRRSETSYYGEIPPTKTTRYEYPSKDRDYDNYGTAQFSNKIKPDHIAMTSGYSTRRPSVAGYSARPVMSRGTAY